MGDSSVGHASYDRAMQVLDTIVASSVSPFTDDTVLATQRALSKPKSKQSGPKQQAQNAANSLNARQSSSAGVQQQQHQQQQEDQKHSALASILAPQTVIGDNTVVDNFPELGMDNIIQQGNSVQMEARVWNAHRLALVQTAFHALRAVRSESRLQEVSRESSAACESDSDESAGEDGANEKKDKRSRLAIRSLLGIHFAQEVASQPSFIQDTIARAFAENRQDELLHMLEARSRFLDGPQGIVRSQPTVPPGTPPQAFLTMSVIHMQLAALRHSYQIANLESASKQARENAASLVSSTCQGLMTLLGPMPLGGLTTLAQWEQTTLDEVVSTLQTLTAVEGEDEDENSSLKTRQRPATPVSPNDDSDSRSVEVKWDGETKTDEGTPVMCSEINELLLALGVQRGSLNGVLHALELLVFTRNSKSGDTGSDDGLLVPWDSALSMRSKPFELLRRLTEIKVFCPLPVWSLLRGTRTTNSVFHCRIRNLESSSSSSSFSKQQSTVQSEKTTATTEETNTSDDNDNNNSKNSKAGKEETSNAIPSSSVPFKPFDTANIYDMLTSESAAASTDGRFVYICGPSVDGIVKVGTGRARLGLNSTIAGHVYAHRWLPLNDANKSKQQHIIEVVVVGARLLVMTRLIGSSLIDVLELDPMSLGDSDTDSKKGRQSTRTGVNEQTFISPDTPLDSVHMPSFVNLLHEDVEMEHLSVVAGECHVSCSGLSGIQISASSVTHASQPVLSPPVASQRSSSDVGNETATVHVEPEVQLESVNQTTSSTTSVIWRGPSCCSATVSTQGTVVCADVEDGGTWLLEGTWYYEVVIEHAGSASIGWISKANQCQAASSSDEEGDQRQLKIEQTNTNNNHNNNSSAGTWGYNGERAISQRGDGTEFAWGARWKAGDVIGVCAKVQHVADKPDGNENIVKQSEVVQWVADFSFSLNGDWEHPMGSAFERVVVGNEQVGDSGEQLGIRPFFTIHEPAVTPVSETTGTTGPIPNSISVQVSGDSNVPPSSTVPISSAAAASPPEAIFPRAVGPSGSSIKRAVLRVNFGWTGQGIQRLFRFPLPDATPLHTVITSLHRASNRELTLEQRVCLCAPLPPICSDGTRVYQVGLARTLIPPISQGAGNGFGRELLVQAYDPSPTGSSAVSVGGSGASILFEPIKLWRFNYATNLPDNFPPSSEITQWKIFSNGHDLTIVHDEIVANPMSHRKGPVNSVSLAQTKRLVGVLRLDRSETASFRRSNGTKGPEYWHAVAWPCGVEAQRTWNENGIDVVALNEPEDCEAVESSSRQEEQVIGTSAITFCPAQNALFSWCGSLNRMAIHQSTEPSFVPAKEKSNSMSIITRQQEQQQRKSGLGRGNALPGKVKRTTDGQITTRLALCNTVLSSITQLAEPFVGNYVKAISGMANKDESTNIGVRHETDEMPLSRDLYLEPESETFRVMARFLRALLVGGIPKLIGREHKQNKKLRQKPARLHSAIALVKLTLINVRRFSSSNGSAGGSMRTALQDLGDSLYEALCSVHKPGVLSTDAVELCRLLTQTLLAGTELFWPTLADKTELITRELQFFEGIHGRATATADDSKSEHPEEMESNSDAVLLPGRTTMRDDGCNSNKSHSQNSNHKHGTESAFEGLDARSFLIAGMLAKSSTGLLACSFEEHHSAVRQLLPNLFGFVGVLTKSALRDSSKLNIDKNSSNEAFKVTHASSEYGSVLTNAMCACLNSVLMSSFSKVFEYLQDSGDIEAGDTDEDFYAQEATDEVMRVAVSVFYDVLECSNEILKEASGIFAKNRNSAAAEDKKERKNESLVEDCVSEAKLKKKQAQDELLSRVGDVMRGGFIGSVTPMVCTWIELLMRVNISLHNSSRSRLVSMLLEKDSSLVTITEFLGEIVKFGSTLSQNTRRMYRPFRCRWSSLERVVLNFESKHNYENDEREKWMIHIPNATEMVVEFDSRTVTEVRRDFVRFLKVRPDGSVFTGGYHDMAEKEDRFGEERYSGSSGWPGAKGSSGVTIAGGNTNTGVVPPLVLTGDKCVCTFTSDSTDTFWGYKFTVSALVSSTAATVCRPWHVHLSSMCRDLAAALVYATLRTASPLTHVENAHLRWIQNPILSGGLKAHDRRYVGGLSSRSESVAVKDSIGLPAARYRTRTRTMSMTEDEQGQAEAMLSELCETTPSGLGAKLFAAMRAKRVPLDQGYFTHRAAACVASALIKVNGMQRDALRAARGGDVSARLIKAWTSAQHIRTWVDQIVVNGQHQRHLEACGVTEIPSRSAYDNTDDFEEAQYAALCELVANRALFLVEDVNAPTLRMVSLRSARQGAARARWHRLRRHFCPSLHQPFQQLDRWDIVLRSIRALSSLKAMVAVRQSAARRMAGGRPPALHRNSVTSADWLKPSWTSSSTLNENWGERTQQNAVRMRARTMSHPVAPENRESNLLVSSEKYADVSMRAKDDVMLGSSVFPMSGSNVNLSATWSGASSSLGRPPMHPGVRGRVRELSMDGGASVSSFNSQSDNGFPPLPRMRRTPSYSSGRSASTPVSELEWGFDAPSPLHRMYLSPPSGGPLTSASGADVASQVMGGPMRVRRRERVSGGLRRYSSTTVKGVRGRGSSRGGAGESTDVDVSAYEHEQSLSESVMTFVQASKEIKEEDLRKALTNRDERAIMRIAGFDLVNSLVTFANKNDSSLSTSSHSKSLFDAVVLAATEALRGHDSIFGFRVHGKINQPVENSGRELGNGVDAVIKDVSNDVEEFPQEAMEAHYLTDLSGCNIGLRNSVAARFVLFLQALSGMLGKGVQLAAGWQARAAMITPVKEQTDKGRNDNNNYNNATAHLSRSLRQIQLLLRAAALDYVENDYGVLDKSNIIPGLLHVILTLDGSTLAPPSQIGMNVIQARGDVNGLIDLDSSLRATAQVGWRVFELLLRRCVCESGQHQVDAQTAAGAKSVVAGDGATEEAAKQQHKQRSDGSSMSGHGVQQSLLDLLIALLQKFLTAPNFSGNLLPTSSSSTRVISNNTNDANTNYGKHQRQHDGNDDMLKHFRHLGAFSQKTSDLSESDKVVLPQMGRVSSRSVQLTSSHVVHVSITLLTTYHQQTKKGNRRGATATTTTLPLFQGGRLFTVGNPNAVETSVLNYGDSNFIEDNNSERENQQPFAWMELGLDELHRVTLNVGGSNGKIISIVSNLTVHPSEQTHVYVSVVDSVTVEIHVICNGPIGSNDIPETPGSGGSKSGVEEARNGEENNDKHGSIEPIYHVERWEKVLNPLLVRRRNVISSNEGRRGSIGSSIDESNSDSEDSVADDDEGAEQSVLNTRGDIHGSESGISVNSPTSDSTPDLLEGDMIVVERGSFQGQQGELLSIDDTRRIGMVFLPELNEPEAIALPLRALSFVTSGNTRLVRNKAMRIRSLLESMGYHDIVRDFLQILDDPYVAREVIESSLDKLHEALDSNADLFSTAADTAPVVVTNSTPPPPPPESLVSPLDVQSTTSSGRIAIDSETIQARRESIQDVIREDIGSNGDARSSNRQDNTGRRHSSVNSRNKNPRARVASVESETSDFRDDDNDFDIQLHPVGGVLLSGPIHIGASPCWGFGDICQPVACGVIVSGVSVVEKGNLMSDSPRNQNSDTVHSIFHLPSDTSGGVITIKTVPGYASVVLPSPLLLSQRASATRRNTGLETSCFRVLALANAASSSVVGRARLSAPFPLGMLFHSVLDDQTQLLVRVGASKVLRNLLVDVSPRAAAKCLLSMLQHDAQADPHGRLSRLGDKWKHVAKNLEKTSSHDDGMVVIVCFAELIGAALFSWTSLLTEEETKYEDSSKQNISTANDNSTPKSDPTSPKLNVPSSTIFVETKSDAREAATMAYELVELLHALCVRPMWANLMAKWIAQSLAHVDISFVSCFVPSFDLSSDVLETEKEQQHQQQQQSNTISTCQDVVVALALLGGLYDSIRVGGEAQVVENSLFGIASERVVILDQIVGHSNDAIPSATPYSPNTNGSLAKSIEITKDMRVAVSTDAKRGAGSAHFVLESEVSTGYWESNGYTPHWVQLECPATLAMTGISMKTDASFDSYSPRTITLKLGPSVDKLRVVKTIELEQRTQWVKLISASDVRPGDAYFRIEITKNHLGGCDTRIRSLRVLGTTNVSAGKEKHRLVDMYHVARLDAASSVDGGGGEAAATPAQASASASALAALLTSSSGGANGAASGVTVYALPSNQMTPVPIRPPDGLLAAVSSTQCMDAALVACTALIDHVSPTSSLDKNNLNATVFKSASATAMGLMLADMRARCLKALCCMLRAPEVMDRIGPAIVPILLRQVGSPARDNYRGALVKVRFGITQSVLEEWSIEIKDPNADEDDAGVAKKEGVSWAPDVQTTSSGNEESDVGEKVARKPSLKSSNSPRGILVRPNNQEGQGEQPAQVEANVYENDVFKSMGGIQGSTVVFRPAGRIHRAVALGVRPMIKGKHSWDCVLLDDSSGDETSLFGITSMPAISAKNWTTSSEQIHKDSPANFLATTKDHWLMRSFNGNRYHQDVPAQWEGMTKLRVHPGDTVHCELDMDKGILVMAVNNGAPILAFRNINAEARWGVYPCIASYGNKSAVRVRVENLQMSFSAEDGNYPSPHVELLLRGPLPLVEQRCERLSRLLYEDASSSSRNVGTENFGAENKQAIREWAKPRVLSRVSAALEEIVADEEEMGAEASNIDAVIAALEQEDAADATGKASPGTPTTNNSNAAVNSSDGTQVISKPAALYEVMAASGLRPTDSSGSAQGGAKSGSSGATAGDSKNQSEGECTIDNEVLASAALGDPRFAGRPEWVLLAARSVLVELETRLSSQALELIVVDWSVTTPSPLPELLFQPDTLPRTLNLVYRTAVHEQAVQQSLSVDFGSSAIVSSGGSGVHFGSLRSVLALRALCGENQGMQMGGRQRNRSIAFFGESFDGGSVNGGRLYSNSRYGVETNESVDGSDEHGIPLALESPIGGGSPTAVFEVQRTPCNPDTVKEMVDLSCATLEHVARVLAQIKLRVVRNGAAFFLGDSENSRRNSSTGHGQQPSEHSIPSPPSQQQAAAATASSTSSAAFLGVPAVGAGVGGAEAGGRLRRRGGIADLSLRRSSVIVPADSNAAAAVAAAAAGVVASSGLTDSTVPPTTALASLAPIVVSGEEYRGELVVGTRVEAKCSGWRRHYPGVITRVNSAPRDTYKVVFDDGDIRDAVTRAEMRFTVEQVHQPVPPSVLSGSSGRVLQRAVLSRNGSTSDSSSSAAVPLRVPSGSTGGVLSTLDHDLLLVGTRVQGRFMGQSKFYVGTIVVVRPDGTYDIQYDDGDHEKQVSRQLIKRLVAPNSSSSVSVNGRSGSVVVDADGNGSIAGSESNGPYVLGAYVHAYLVGGWTSAVVYHVNTDNTYRLMLDSGAYADNVPAVNITTRNPNITASSSSPVVPAISTTAAATQGVGEVVEPPTTPDEHIPATTPAGVAMAPTGAILEQGMQYLLSDRFGGELPEEGKPDSAQVSIINNPAVADGLVLSVTLRLGENPAGGSDSWEVMVFEMLGENTNNFFVVTDLNKPVRGVIHFDPNSREVQTLPVEGSLRISQGQYLGVMNRFGRLNVSYTPGKKKPGESWAQKPVEVFYLMPRAVPTPFVGGPHRAKEWHGRAGWFSVVSVEQPAGVDLSLHHKQLVDNALQELNVSPKIKSSEIEEGSYMPAYVGVQQACWLLSTLVRERFVFSAEVLAKSGLLKSLQLICAHGIFLVDSVSPLDDAETMVPSLSAVWLPIVNLISSLFESLIQDIQYAQKGMCLGLDVGLPLPFREAEQIMSLRDLVENKACEMFVARQRWSEKEAIKGGSASNTKSTVLGGTATSPTNLWFQRLLQCLISVKHLTKGIDAGSLPSLPVRGLPGGDVADELLAVENGTILSSPSVQLVSEPLDEEFEDDMRSLGTDALRSSTDETYQLYEKVVLVLRASAGGEATKHQTAPPALLRYAYTKLMGRGKERGLTVAAVCSDVLDADSEERVALEKVRKGDRLVSVNGVHVARLHGCDGESAALLVLAMFGPGAETPGSTSEDSQVMRDELMLYLEAEKEFDGLSPTAASAAEALAMLTSSNDSSSSVHTHGVGELTAAVVRGCFDTVELVFERPVIATDSRLERNLRLKRQRASSLLRSKTQTNAANHIRTMPGYDANTNERSFEDEDTDESQRLEWLNALMTATELLKSFANTTLPPEQLMIRFFCEWRQRCATQIIESEHPVVLSGESDEVVCVGTRQARTKGSSRHGVLRRDRWISMDVDDENEVGSIANVDSAPPTRSFPSVDSILPLPPPLSSSENYAVNTGNVEKAALLGVKPRSSLSFTTLFLSEQEASVAAATSLARARTSSVLNTDNNTNSRSKYTLRIPGAIALRLEWDAHTCLRRGDGSVIVVSCGSQGEGPQFRGVKGLPPPLDYVSGDTLSIAIESIKDIIPDADSYHLPSQISSTSSASSTVVPSQRLRNNTSTRKSSRSNISRSPIGGETDSRSTGVGRAFGRPSVVSLEQAASTAASIHTYLERVEFTTSSLYGKYVSRNVTIGTLVRCSETFESIELNDTGRVVNIDTSDDLPCQVLWDGLGSAYWLPWEHISLNLTSPVFPHRNGPPTTPSLEHQQQQQQQRVASARSASVVSPGGRPSSARPPSNAMSSNNACTFSTPAYFEKYQDNEALMFDSGTADQGADIELYNDKRSATRIKRLGWGMQLLNVWIDATRGVTTVRFRVDENTSSHLFIGVVSADSTLRSMADRHAWGLRRDGSLYADGLEVRGPSPQFAFEEGQTVSVVVDMSDPKERAVTFLNDRAQCIGVLTGLPTRVVPAVCFGALNQHISIVKVFSHSADVEKAHLGWGLRLTVVPVFASHSEPDTAVGKSISEDVKGIGLKTYVELQNTWTRKQDELLRLFADDVAAELSLSLKEQLHTSWDVLSATCAMQVRVDGRRRLRSSLEAVIAERLPIHDQRMDAVYSVVVEVAGEESHASAVSEDLSISPRRKSRSSSLTANNNLSRNRLTSVLASAKRGGSVTAEGVLLESILDDIGQRFEVLRTLNASVYRALSLLDLTTWRANQSPAAHLSEICTLLFMKFKHELWRDAINITRAQDTGGVSSSSSTRVNKFELVLDFGRAMSRRSQADLRGRHTVFAQAFRVMHPMPPSDLRVHGKLYKATLRGMGSHDDGGPYRQSFTQYTAELQAVPGVGLFLPCANRANQIHVNRDRWLPNPAATSAIQVQMFEFVGKLMGIAVRNREFLDLRLPSLVWKQLVNQIPTIDDLRAVDLFSVTNLEETATGVIGESAGAPAAWQGLAFTAIMLDGREVELMAGGSQLFVTRENYEQWAQLTLEFKIQEFDVQVEAIRRGLASIVPQRMLMLFSWEELELMVCGEPHIDLELLREMTVYSDCAETDRHIQLFWKVLEGFSDEQRSAYLKFVWGRSRLPLRRQDWEQAHKLAAFHPPKPSPGNTPAPLDEYLPFGHTCYFTLDVPRYSSEEIMKSKLLFAIENCPEIDGDQTTTGRRAAAMGFEIYSDDDDDNDNDNDADDDGSGAAMDNSESAGGGIADEFERTASNSNMQHGGTPDVSDSGADADGNRASPSSSPGGRAFRRSPASPASGVGLPPLSPTLSLMSNAYAYGVSAPFSALEMLPPSSFSWDDSLSLSTEGGFDMDDDDDEVF